jgi:TonB family protein
LVEFNQSIMAPRILSFSAAALALSVSACAKPKPSKYVADACPIAGQLRGYPVSVSSSVPADTALLGDVARAMAASLSSQLAHGDDKPPVPPIVRVMDARIERGNTFSRNGWRPAPGDTARLRLVYRVGATAPEISLVHSGEPTRFELSVQRAAQAAIADAYDRPGARYTLPLAVSMPNAAPATLDVAFGREPDSLSGVARFSVHEAKVLPTVGNRPPTYPQGALRAGMRGYVKIAFVVLPDSTADMASVQVLQSSQPEFADAVMRSLPRFRYIPGEIDCRLVPTVVEQPFTFEIGEKTLTGQ